MVNVNSVLATTLCVSSPQSVHYDVSFLGGSWVSIDKSCYSRIHNRLPFTMGLKFKLLYAFIKRIDHDSIGQLTGFSEIGLKDSKLPGQAFLQILTCFTSGTLFSKLRNTYK